MSIYLIHSRQYYILVSTVYLYHHLCLDVSDLLFPEVHSCDYIQSFNISSSSIILPKWTCNENKYTIFDFSQFALVESIEISDHCYAFVKTFQIVGLNQLKTIKIGKNSFTQKKNGYGNDISKSFHILNCTKLESIEIGEYSFSDYGGQFELNGLPELQSLIIGSNSTNSYNFYSSSSFEIESIILIY